MRCAKCQRESDNLTKSYEPGFIYPLYVCSDDRTCAEIVESRMTERMKRVKRLASKFVTREGLRI